jgi:hypothetical protein
VRWTRGVPRQKAYLFIPDDVRLRTWATQIADARRHSLHRPLQDDAPPGDEFALDELRHADDRPDQLSMFAALSAVVTGEDTSSVFDLDDEALASLDELDGDDRADSAFELTLPALPSGAPGEPAGRGPGGGPSPRQQRSELREANAKLVQDLVWATGMGHAQVNGQLNRLVGLRRVDEATIDQLRRRARQAERWLATL